MTQTTGWLLSAICCAALLAGGSCTGASDGPPVAKAADPAASTDAAPSNAAPSDDGAAATSDSPAADGPPAEVAQATAKDAQTAEIPAAEKPFYASAQEFVDAYAKRNADAIGELFTEEAEFFDEYGERTTGRAAIIELFQSVFEESPQALIEEVQLTGIRPITDRVVVEEGTTISRAAADAPQESSRYIALHVKGDDDRWRIDMFKSVGRNARDRGMHLGQVAWLIGDWVCEDSQSVVETTCRWSDDGNYLLRHFKIVIDNETRLEGVQRIGWDPVTRQLRSWTFDSGGGFMEGTWSRAETGWIVASRGVTAEGKPATATAVYEIVDAELFRWQYQNLVVGDEFHTDMPVIVMTRRPPAAKTAAK